MNRRVKDKLELVTRCYELVVNLIMESVDNLKEQKLRLGKETRSHCCTNILLRSGKNVEEVPEFFSFRDLTKWSKMIIPSHCSTK